MAIYDGFIFAGHGISELTGGYDPGATSGEVKENDLANSIITSALNYLAPTGLNIHRDENNYTDDDLLGNTYKYKSGIVVHINAGGGTGTEIFVPSNEKYLDCDFMITHAISMDLGIANRGVKSKDYNSEVTTKRVNGLVLGGRDYYKEIRQAWEKGISLSILEVGFIDTGDLGKIQANIDLIGRRVAEYIAFNCNAILPNTSSKPEPTKIIHYQGHVQEMGWQDLKSNDEVCGTTGKSLRLEALMIAYPGIKFRGHIENLGWTNYRESGEILGTIGQAKRLEAIEILSEKLEFSVHTENEGWTGYIKNGTLGTTGQAKRIEAIKIREI